MEIILIVNENPNILLVEDDASLAEWIIDYLSDNGFAVTHSSQGDIAIELINDDKPDLVLLDLMLPRKNGFEICQTVRRFYSSPILIMTASTEETDEILGLELGADDYITKPIKPRVLLARIKALLRRETSENGENHLITVGTFQIDSESKSVKLDGAVLPISMNEFDVLWILAKRAGQIVSRTELISQLRGFDYDGFDRTIDIRISRLRKKLADTTPATKIKTIRGKGYLLAKDAWT